MKLSMLDQAPISAGQTAGQALHQAIRLAQAGERFGYYRYWLAEHHQLDGLASSAPEVMLAAIGALTATIRLGAGAILLPYYKPYKISETFNLLASLYPDRIDLGIARSPGGPAEASMALSDNFLEGVWKLPERFEELLHYLRRDLPADHPHANAVAAPLPSVPPEPWLLGTSVKSAKLAAAHGTAYAYGHFMHEEGTEAAMEAYFTHFQPGPERQKPYFMLAASALCADSEEQALGLARSAYVWRQQAAQGTPLSGIPSLEEAQRYLIGRTDEDIAQHIRARMIIGDAREVRMRLAALQARYQADELMLITYTHDFADRLRSYERIAAACL